MDVVAVAGAGAIEGEASDGDCSASEVAWWCCGDSILCCFQIDRCECTSKGNMLMLMMCCRFRKKKRLEGVGRIGTWKERSFSYEK